MTYFRGRKLQLIFTGFILALLGVTAVSMDAQTRKRRKSVVRNPVVLPTPPSSEPLIISRAEDFPDGGTTAAPVQRATSLTPATSTGDENAKIIADLEARIKSLEATQKTDPDAKHKKLLLNLDILTRAEQRAETLRKQVFDLMEKENTTRAKVGQIDNDLRPESIDRTVAFAGSLRPEELRSTRKKTLEAEKANLENLLVEIQRNRANLDQSVQKADALVEKLRARLEKEIDAALDDESDKPQQ